MRALCFCALLFVATDAWGLGDALAGHKHHKHSVKKSEKKRHEKLRSATHTHGRGDGSAHFHADTQGRPQLFRLVSMLDNALKTFFKGHKSVCFKGWKPPVPGFLPGCSPNGCRTFDSLDKAKKACQDEGTPCGGIVQSGRRLSTVPHLCTSPNAIYSRSDIFFLSKELLSLSFVEAASPIRAPAVRNHT